MTKQEQYFAKVAEFMERFRLLRSEEIRHRLVQTPLTKEAAVAYKQVLQERGEAV
jgi:hypothetical protein